MADRYEQYKRIGLFGPLPDGIKLLKANTPELLKKARCLVNQVYASEDYGQASNNDQMETWAATTQDGQVVSVISLASDSADGLPADRWFKEELDVLRLGAKLCEGTNWVAARKYRFTSIMTHLLAIMLRTAYLKRADWLLGVMSEGHKNFVSVLGMEQLANGRSASKSRFDPVYLVGMRPTYLVGREDLHDGFEKCWKQYLEDNQ